MHWIESIALTSNGQLELVGRSLNGEVKRLKPKDYPSELGSGNKMRATLLSNEHEVTSVDEYLARMRWAELDGQAQRLHRFRTPGLEVWIPSQVMLKMLFGKVIALYECAFSGRSLQEIAVPSFSDDPMALLPGWTNCNKNCRTVDTSRNRFFWLQSSLSAARSYRSVFRSALDGVLDVLLPNARFEVFLTGKRDGDVLLATVANLAVVQCDDLVRLDGKPLQPMRLDLVSETAIRSRRLSRGFQYQRTESLERWRLTDSHFRSLLEWHFQNGVFKTREDYTEDHQKRLKLHLELLRARFLGKLEWSSLPCTPQELACVQVRYYKLRRAGAWEEFSRALLSG